MPNDKHADAQRSMELVGRCSQRVDIERPKVHGDLAHRLGGVGVDERCASMSNSSGLSHGLNDASLVAGEHDAYERALRNAFTNLISSGPLPLMGRVREG